jgi:hypothetical protein
LSAKASFWNSKIRSRILISLAVCLFLGLGTLLRPQAPTQYPKYLAESPSPSGIKAFYTLLKNNSTQVGIWKKPAQALPSTASGQLMILVEPSTPLTSNEINQWTKWMEAGNHLLLVAENPQGAFNLRTAPAGDPDRSGTVVGSEKWKETYQATIETDLRLVPESNDKMLLQDQLGVVALSRAYGEGELMVLLAPEWLTNGVIAQKDHLQLLLLLISRADPKVIWFNDFIHGSNNLPAVLGVYPEWFLVLLAQLALGLLLWLWYKGKRFGPIRTPREWVVRFGDERIRAIASWYERGKFYQESLAIQVEFLRQAVAERWGIPTNLQGQEFITAALQRIPPDQQQRWLKNWQGLTAAYAHKISQQAYLKWSKLLDEMQKEVEQR